MQGIKKKLLTSFFAIITALLISEIFFIATDYLILSKYMKLTDNMISEYSLINKSSVLLSSFNDRIKTSSNGAEAEKFYNNYNETKSLLAKLKKSIVGGESKIIFVGLENNINDIIFDVEIGANSLSGGDYLEATNRYISATRKNSFVQENVINLLLKELEYAKNLQIEIDRVRLISQGIGIFLLIVITGGCIWYAVAFSGKLISPLIRLAKLAKKIGDGSLNASVDKDLLMGNDEVASLSNSFETMVKTLRDSIKKLEEYNKEIKNSKNSLQAEKNKLQQYLDVAGVIVLIFDTNNKVLLINKKGCEIIGAKASEIIGQDWVGTYVKRKNQIQTRSSLIFLLGNVNPVDTLENIIISKDKSEKNIVWHFSILHDGNGSDQTILATGVDVTELTKAKITINQLKEVDNLKNEVLNIATHELKTPLISIVGLSEVMEQQPKTIPTEYQNYISIIRKEGKRLVDLIKTMLTASRNEIGEASAVKEKFDLVELLLSLKTSLSVLVKRTNSQVSFNIQPKKLIITSDKEKIHQVIYNLVDNAVKYGTEKQTIDLNLFLVNDKFVKIEVRGDGQGISKEMQKKLFVKFSQLEPTLSRSQDGMGLGLYICKQNVENLGGEIGVKSSIGKGATFYFTLPL